MPKKKKAVTPKKRTKKDFIKWLNNELMNARHALSMNHWNLKVNQNVSEGDWLFEIHYSLGGYHWCRVDWSQDAFNRFETGTPGEMETLKMGCLHEIMHIVLRDLKSAAVERYTTPTEISKAEESVCDHLAVILNRLIHRNWKPYN